MLAHVILSKEANKSLPKIPKHVVLKLNSWVRLVETRGLAEARKIPGYHDEPLKGDRAGQRSIRLSRSYRAIYTVTAAKMVELVVVEEINKHDY